MTAIEVHQLTKRFDQGSVALKSVDLQIHQGDIFGFLGPNGAGKTTMVRILNGVLNPSEGSAKIMGLDVAQDKLAIHQICGVMTETANSYEHLSGRENLRLFADLHEMPVAQGRARTEEMLSKLDLLDHADKQVKHYSTGMKRRLLIARALLHQPKVVFLDEPTSGLDPEAAYQVNQMVRALAKEQQMTVFLCTHQLKYAQDLCTRYGFIHQGQLLGSGTFDELLAMRQGGCYGIFELRKPLLGEPQQWLGKWESDLLYKVPIEPGESLNQHLLALLQAGGEIQDARQSRWSLEDLYFDFQKEVE